MRKVLFGLLWVLGIYLILRAIVELFVIDYGDPASYAADWGGPSLFGVLLVHCGPGLLFAGWAIWWLLRRRRRAVQRTS
jgi:hypothetical protein